MLETREAFLTAIFDAPADDLPRLAFADWLDDRGEAAFARLLRVGVEWQTLGEEAVQERGELAAEGFRLAAALGRDGNCFMARGLHPNEAIELSGDLLADLPALRAAAAFDHPEWYGDVALKITAGRLTGGAQVENLFSAACLSRVTKLDFSGLLVEAPVRYSLDPTAILNPFDTEVRTVITTLGVEALAKHRAAGRITELLLANNDLDNDAARMLVKSPFLTSLTRLEIRTGNQLRGSTWSQLVERFGDEVVG